MNRNPQPPPDWENDQPLWDLLGRAREIEPSIGFTERTLRRLHSEPVATPQLARWLWRWALAGGLAIVALMASVGYRHTHARQQAALYAAVQQTDYPEDFDVIAALHWIEGEHTP
ncbi:MAG: hypothetical protein NZ483_10155 [Verrucomicrobiae bacterium]|nr:hypothetical protein [Verrucomicrobiae bacterium]MDW8344039.1 hypothetical protein [Verrucomicrobiae bacterium]